MSIKYYHLAKDEELPDEFCAVRDINGEPSEYTFYEQMNEFDCYVWAAFKQSDWFAGSEYRKLQAENAKLRELCAIVIDDWMSKVCPTFPLCECGGEYESCTDETCGNQIYRQMARELGMEADG